MSLTKTPEQKSREKAHTKIKNLAQKFSLGEKNSYKFEQGINEFAREFQTSQQPFGFMKLNGEPVFYVDKQNVVMDKHKEFVRNASLSRTGIDHIFYLREGKTATTTVVRSFLFGIAERED